MGPTLNTFARILPVYHDLFPPDLLQRFWKEAQPHNYSYKIDPTAVPLALLRAFITRRPNLEEILKESGDAVGTHAKSTLSEFLASPPFADFVQLMLDYFKEARKPVQPGPERIWPTDTMALTLSRTARSDAPKFNNKTIGIGLTWMLDLEPDPGCSPFKVLKIHREAWSDAEFLASSDRPPLPCDPLATSAYDRGFSGHRGIARCQSRQEAFLVRLRKDEVKYFQVLKHVSRRKRCGSLRILYDCMARIGNKTPVEVRLAWAELPGGDPLIVATSRNGWSIEKILEGYRQRWPIEPMHKVIKDTIGLAHLYSLQESGMRGLMQLALLLSGLVWISLKPEERIRDSKGKIQVVASIREGVKRLRRLAGERGTWKRNLPQRSYQTKTNRCRGSMTRKGTTGKAAAPG